MHHSKAEIWLMVGVGLTENPKEIVAYLSHFEERFKLIIGHILFVLFPVNFHPAIGL